MTSISSLPARRCLARRRARRQIHGGVCRTGRPICALEDHITYGMTRSGGLGEATRSARCSGCRANVIIRSHHAVRLSGGPAAAPARCAGVRTSSDGFASPLPLVTYQTQRIRARRFHAIHRPPQWRLAETTISRCEPDLPPALLGNFGCAFRRGRVSVVRGLLRLTLKRWLWDGQKPKALTPSRRCGRPRIIVRSMWMPDGDWCWTRRSVALRIRALHWWMAAVLRSPSRRCAVRPGGGPDHRRGHCAGRRAAALRLGRRRHIGGGNVRDNAGDSLVFDPGGSPSPSTSGLPFSKSRCRDACAYPEGSGC